MNATDAALRSKVPLKLQIAILSVPFLMMGPTAVGAGLGTVKAAFPDAAISTINLIQTAPSLMTFPVALIAGAIAGRGWFTYRRLALLGTIVFTLGGLAGSLFVDNLYALIASRFVFGIGNGLIFPTGQMLVYHYVTDKAQHQKFLGWNNMMNNAGGVIFQYVGGILAAINYKLIFLVYFLGLISVICVFVGLKEVDDPAETVKEEIAEEEKKEAQLGFVDSIKAIPAILWLVIVCYGLFIVFKTPGTMLMSYYVADNGGTPIDSANILTAFTVTGIVASAIFPVFYKIFNRFTVCVGMLMQVAAFLVMYYGGVIGCWIGMILAGLALVLAMPGLQKIISALCPAGADTFASGLMMCLMNLAMFTGGYWADFAKVVGADTYFAWVASAIAIGVLVVIVFFIALKDRPEYHDNKEEKAA